MSAMMGASGLLSLLFGLGQQYNAEKALQLIQDSVQPGALPGTRGTDNPVFGNTGATGIRAIDTNPYGAAYADMFNTLGQYSPQGTSLAAQLAANQQSRDAQRSLLDRMLGDAQGSRLGQMAGDLRGMHANLIDRTKSRENLAAAARTRAAGTEATRDELLGRLRGTEQETGEYFRGVRDNPNIFSSADIERMAAQFAEGQQAQGGLATADLENRATRQGLSPAAVEALRLQGRTAENAANQQYRRDVQIQNAVQSAGRADQAASGLATLSNMLYGTEAGIGQGYGALAEGQRQSADAMDRWIEENLLKVTGSLYPLEGQLVGEYEDRINRVRGMMGELEQPENLAGVGSLLDEIDRYNVDAQAAALAGRANSYAGNMNAALGFLQSQQANKLAADAQPSGWQKFWGSGGNALTNYGLNLEMALGLGLLG